MKKALLALFFCLFAFPLFAQTTAPLETVAKQAILIDMATGSTLFAKDADQRMATSSMSKVLTMYLVFEALRNGKLKMDMDLPVSQHAWEQTGSRMLLNPGDHAKVEDLIRGVIVQSGNDAAVTFAEALGVTESGFATMMNAKAAQLGMNNSHFMNATGLPDPDHYSTARDLAILAQAMMRDFPEYYHYFAEQEFTYNKIKQGNRNPLLYHNIGVDGLKTGHTDAGGFGLIASSLREGRRLVLVVNGLGDMQERADEPAKILDWGYREYGLFPIVKQGEKLAEASVWLGRETTVPLVAGKDVTLSLPRSARNGLRVVARFEQPLRAPVAKGQDVGKITISAPGTSDVEVPLLADSNVEQLGFFARLWVKFGLLFHKA